jgi:glutaredoxin
MKRFAPALAALLLACAPPSDDESDSAAPAAPAEQVPASVKPRAPKRALEQPPARKSKSTLEAGGSYYQYVDESGHVRFAATLEDVPERQRSTAGHISVTAPSSTRTAAATSRTEAANAEVTTNAEVVLYTTESCPYCKRAIAYLDQIGQDYVNKNVEQDEHARDEYLRLTGGRAGVPVIVVGDQWMQGWSQAHLDQLLAASR